MPKASADADVPEMVSVMPKASKDLPTLNAYLRAPQYYLWDA